MIIELACRDLDPSTYSHVRHFTIDLLMAQTEKLNSSEKLKIDESFYIMLLQVSNIEGGSCKRKKQTQYS